MATSIMQPSNHRPSRSEHVGETCTPVRDRRRSALTSGIVYRVPAYEPVKKLPDSLAETKPDLTEQPSTIVAGPHHPLIPAHAGIQFFQKNMPVWGKLDARVRGHERRLAGSGPDVQGELTLAYFLTAAFAGMTGWCLLRTSGPRLGATS
jgi:hypothetical protein